MEAFEEPKPLLNYLIKPVPRTGGDLSRPLGRVPRFFVDIYVAAVHRSLLRPNHRTICNEKLAILRFAKRIRPNNIPQTGDFDEPFDLESSANSCLVVEKRRMRRERKRRKENNALFLSSPSLLESPTLEHSCCTNPSVPFRSLPIRVTSHAHVHTHTYTYIHVAKNRGGEEIVTERGEREREKDTERYGTEMSHAESHRRLSLSPRLLFFVRPLLREHADWTRRYGRLGGAWSRVPRELTRAAAREPLRSTVRSPARLAATHLPTFLAPDRRSPLPLSSSPPSLFLSISPPRSRVYVGLTQGEGEGALEERGFARKFAATARSRNCVP